MISIVPVVSHQRLLADVQAWPPALADDLPGGPWSVVHVRPRQEKLLAGNLLRLGVPNLLFLERSVRTYLRQGTQVSMLPLLPGYLFVLCPPERWDAVYQTERVVRMLHVTDQAALRSDLADLVALVRRAPVPLLVRPELVPGIPVVLTAGSLAGVRGIIDRRRGRSEVVVNVRMLGSSVALTCAAEDVAEVPVEDQARSADEPRGDRGAEG